ncbi:amidohydrolase family protein [Massilia sp. TWP1-3-3]|uniref:amidohydrolase family protein n=2 Tax=unclassified Massilia TaxID=2609279 RepID=UPI003CFBA08B
MKTFAIRCVLAACATLLCACQRTAEAPLPHVEQLNRLSGPTRDLAIELREGTNMAASPSPDGKQVVFSMQGALWVMPIAGGNAQRITGWELEPTWPVWSPDGKTIAFQNYAADGNYHLWTITPDGRSASELTSGPWDDREPAWLPDGSALVFASDRGNDQQYKIWRLTLDGMALVQLTEGKGAESQPAVSPDGKRLAWTDSARIYTQALTPGAAPVAVAPGSAPAWTPNSKTLAYQNLAGQLTLGNREVTVNEDMFPFPVRFLPDGRFLYTADGKIRLRRGDASDPVDLGFEATMLVRRPGPARARERGFGNRSARPVLGISAPTLSPDGTRIAFVALNDVWVMALGQTPQRLTHDLDRDAGVQWTSDGGAVYFASERANGGRFAIDRIDLVTRARTRLAAVPGQSMGHPKMSPSGRYIAYTGEAGQLALWDLAGASSVQIAAGAGSEVSAPSWSADERHVMVVANERVNNRFREGYNKLRVSDIVTGEQRFYAVGPAPRQVSERDEGAAVLAPDGRQVAFIMDSVLYVMPLNADASPAGAPRQLTTEAADLPSFSGNGATILYKAADQLKLIAAAGGPARQARQVHQVHVNLAWTQAAPTGTLLIRAGALWDGVSPVLRRDVDILVTGNRIVWVRAHQDGAETAAARFIDASQLTVLPGLWDSSVLPADRFGPAAAAMLAYGVTSALSSGGPLHQGVELREALEAGDMVGPRLFAATALLGGNRVLELHARSLRTSAVADLEIAKARRMGVDFMAADARAPVALMNRIAQGALALGVQSGAGAAAPALIAGIGGAAPLPGGQRLGYDWSRSVLMGIGYQDAHTLYGNGELRLTDTLAATGALLAYDPALMLDPRMLLAPPDFAAAMRTARTPGAAVMAAIRRDAQQQARVIAAGALVSNGSAGPPGAPGISLHLNLRAAGMAMTRHQALQTVTINAARHARVGQDLGSVEAGKLADLVLVRGNPLQDLTAAANVEYVIKNGNVFTQAQIVAPFRMPPCADQAGACGPSDE